MFTYLFRPRRLIAAALVAGGLSFGLAYRFALKYRARAGLPNRSPVEASPADFGLAFESVAVPSDGATLAGWWIPAVAPQADGKVRPAAEKARPAVAIVHGWESNRGRSLAHARYLNAAGFHCLLIDGRGHGDNPPEELAVSFPEFGADAAAAARWLAARPDVSSVGLLGHSMGGAGVILAAASEPSVAAVVALSTPADLVRMTRETFAMADLNVPQAVATPLAYLTAAIMLVPRRHSIEDADVCLAASRYRGPLLLLHGADDHGVPVEHLALLAEAARDTRRTSGAAVESMIVPEYGHRWLYEPADVRRRIASFLAGSLGGLVTAEKAGKLAADCVVERPANPRFGFGSATASQVAAAQEREKTRRRARSSAARLN